MIRKYEMMKKLALILLVVFIGCSIDEETADPILCTDDLRPGLEITVRDNTTDAVLVEGVTMVATDGDYSETLQNTANSDTFVGAIERRGTYFITITKEGYQTFSSTVPIFVDVDLCHVILESRTFLLQSN